MTIILYSIGTVLLPQLWIKWLRFASSDQFHQCWKQILQMFTLGYVENYNIIFYNHRRQRHPEEALSVCVSVFCVGVSGEKLKPLDRSAASLCTPPFEISLRINKVLHLTYPPTLTAYRSQKYWPDVLLEILNLSFIVEVNGAPVRLKLWSHNIDIQ